MHFNALVAATALAGLIPSTLAKGSATVRNQCDKKFAVESIANTAGEGKTTVKPGDSYSEEFQENSNGGGISIKISTEDNKDEISQFEYTLSPKDSKVFYDLSHVDGDPFRKGGASVTTSNKDCPSISCPAGEKCMEAYNNPKDDHATKGCSDDTDLTLTLCGDSAGGEKKRNVRHPHWYQA